MTTAVDAKAPNHRLHLFAEKPAPGEPYAGL